MSLFQTQDENLQGPLRIILSGTKCCGSPSWLLPFLAFLLRSDDRVEGIVKPLHRQIHHFSEGIILYAFVLIADWLIGWEEQMETIIKKSEKHNSTTTYKSLRLTRVSKQMRIVFPSTVTEMFFSSLKSTLSSPNMSLSAADTSRQTVTLRDSTQIPLMDPSVTHCSMTPSRVWKTSMSMTADWHSITGDDNKSEESTTGRQDFYVHRCSPTDLSEPSGSTGPPAPRWWRRPRTCHSEGWRSTAAERIERQKKIRRTQGTTRRSSNGHLLLTSSITMLDSWTRVMFLKIFRVLFSVPSTSSTSPGMVRETFSLASRRLHLSQRETHV